MMLEAEDRNGVQAALSVFVRQIQTAGGTPAGGTISRAGVWRILKRLDLHVENTGVDRVDGTDR